MKITLSIPDVMLSPDRLEETLRAAHAVLLTRVPGEVKSGEKSMWCWFDATDEDKQHAKVCNSSIDTIKTAFSHLSENCPHPGKLWCSHPKAAEFSLCNISRCPLLNT